VLDLIYVLLTIGFFGLMLAYVRGCERLGRDTLIRHAGKFLTHRQLLKDVWGPNAVEHRHCLRVYMTQLRHKLEVDAARPRYLLTEPGVGYRLHAE
jgi:DNA-binding response OmpR family regulator